MKRPIAILICTAVLLISITSVLASNVNYENPSEGYAGSKYHRNLLAVELTGDMRHDVIAVAVSQVYYYEGNGIFDFAGLNPGSGNYTEYNYDYGKLDQEGNGTLTYGYPWCASFLTFCLKYACIPESVSSRHVNCTSWLNIYKKEQNGCKFYEKGSYTPIMGDIVFFKNDASSTRPSDHVGFVLATDSQMLYTIEGNASGGVNYKAYDLNNTKIVGYGVPAYESEITKSNISGKYVVIASGALNMREGPSTSYGIITSLPHGAEVSATEFSGGWAKITYNGKAGWVSGSYLTPYEFMRVEVTLSDKFGNDTLYVMRNSPFSVTVPDAVDGLVFDGYECDGNSYGEVQDRRVILSLSDSMTLTANYKEALKETEAPEETKETDTKGSESGCASVTTLPASAVILLSLLLMLIKKKNN